MTSERRVRSAPSEALAPAAAPRPVTEPQAAQRFRIDLELALREGEKNLSAGLSADELVRLVRSSVGEVKRLTDVGDVEGATALRQQLGAEVRRQSEAHAASPLTLLALDTLAIVLEYAPAGSFVAAAAAGAVSDVLPGKELEAWLVAAGEGARARGVELGAWYAPYVQGSTPVPRDTEVIEAMRGFLERLTPSSSRGPAAEKFIVSLSATQAIRAAYPDATADPRRYIVWGQSMGGAGSIQIANELADRKVELVLPVDIFHAGDFFSPLLRPTYEVRDGVEVLNFFQKGLLAGNRKLARPAPSDTAARADAPSALLHSEEVPTANHFSILADVYDRGLFHQAIARAVFRAANALPAP